MDEDQLRLYHALSRAPFPKSYVGKVFLAAFRGTHVPLLALLVYFVRRCRFALGSALRRVMIAMAKVAIPIKRTTGSNRFIIWYPPNVSRSISALSLRFY